MEEGTYMKRLIGFSAILLFGLLVTLPSFSIVRAVGSYYFEDSFETGNLSSWDGRAASNGETIGVSSFRSLIGAYSGRATSNGGGGVEYAYCYKQLSSEELYVTCGFLITGSGIVENGDRFFLISLQNGANTLASCGWSRIDGIVKWFLLVRDGSNSSITYSTQSPSLNVYYSLSLHWKKDSINGMGELGIRGDDGAGISIHNKNTAAYGDVIQARFGLPTISYCGSTSVYFDHIKMSSSELEWLTWGCSEIGFDDYTFFSDGFETGSFSCWSGTIAHSGGLAKVVSQPLYDGMHTARFISGATGLSSRAYCYKNVYTIENFYHYFHFRAVVRVSACNIRENGGFDMYRLSTNGVTLSTFGWYKTNGALRWRVSGCNGTSTAYAYSQSVPALDTWYLIDAYWTPASQGPWCYARLSVTDPSGTGVAGACVELYETLYYSIDRVDCGLVSMTNCRGVSLYLDGCRLSEGVWE